MEEFVQTVKDLLETQQWQKLKALLAPKNPNDLAHIFAEFESSERVVLFRLLEKQEAVEVFESLPLEEQQELLGSFKQEQLRVGRHGACQLEPFPFDHGKTATQLISLIIQFQKLEKLLCLALSLVDRIRVYQSTNGNRFKNCKLLEGLGNLKSSCNTLLADPIGRKSCDVVVVKKDRPLIGRMKARDEIK